MSIFVLLDFRSPSTYPCQRLRHIPNPERQRGKVSGPEESKSRRGKTRDQKEKAL